MTPRHHSVEKILVIGAGGHAKVVLDILNS